MEKESGKWSRSQIPFTAILVNLGPYIWIAELYTSQCYHQSWNNFGESVFSFYHIGLGDWTQAIRLGDKCLIHRIVLLSFFLSWGRVLLCSHDWTCACQVSRMASIFLPVSSSAEFGLQQCRHAWLYSLGTRRSGMLFSLPARCVFSSLLCPMDPHTPSCTPSQCSLAFLNVSRSDRSHWIWYVWFLPLDPEVLKR